MRSLKEEGRPNRKLTAIPTGAFFFFPSANLAESEVGNNNNLTGFKSDSLGRMADSEASNEGFYVKQYVLTAILLVFIRR